MVVPPASVILLVAPDALLTTATALSLAIRTLGGTIGFSIYLSIFTKKLTTNLPAYVAQYAVEAGLPAGDAADFVATFLETPTTIATVPGYTLEIAEAAAIGVKWAYAESLHYVWYTSVAFGVAAIICVAFLPTNTSRFQTNRIAVSL